MEYEKIKIDETDTFEKICAAAAEGAVLLENNGVLPLKGEKPKIALYGVGAILTVKGGTGSGDVMQEHVITIEEALEEAGFVITTKDWLADCRKRNEEAEAARYAAMHADVRKTGDPLMSVFLRHPQVLTEGGVIPKFPGKKRDETAVYVISRISGESADRKKAPGDYELTGTEREQMERLAENYQDVIIVLNTGSVIDTGFFREISGLSALLQISQAGVACGIVLADLLSGKRVPSGKLTATWAENYANYPASAKFRDNSRDEKVYEEGIYVGYRYFDTFQVKPAYAFGYGRSYTEFSWEMEEVRTENGEIHILLKVTNIGGQYSGKEVLQAYVSSPAGKLDKPYQELRAFRKTKELAPGETQRVELVFQAADMASYDEERAAYILEKGRYVVRVGNSSNHTRPVAVLTLDQTVETCRLKNKLVPEQEIRQKCACGHETGEEYREKKNTEKENRLPEVVLDTADIRKEFPYEESADRAGATIIRDGEKTEAAETKELSFEVVRNGKCTLKELVDALSPEEMAALCVGAGAIGNGAVIGSAAMKVPGAAGETTSVLQEKWGIPDIIFADGPAGLRLVPRYQIRKADGSVVVPKNGFLALTGFERLAGKPEEEPDCLYRQQKTTAIPNGTMLAQTWNPEVISEIGRIVGQEMRRYGIQIWLAPALNIQRDPLGGRNFEYYSEDPLLSGVCAGAMTHGIQSVPGCGVAVKHFAANSQEENRFDTNSVVSERALREIYLKGFEKAVREEQPMMLMSSYNRINGVHTANSRELLTDILRTEWKFQGAVVTDWGTTRNGMRAGFGGRTRSLPRQCMAAGNNLIMPGDQRDREEILEAAADGSLDPEDLKSCAEGLLRIMLRLYPVQ